MSWLYSQILVVNLIHIRHPQQRQRHFVDGLVTFEAGQRLIPRYFHSINENSHPVDVCNDHDNVISNDNNSVWDLPHIEQWATQRQLSQHHLKTIYRVATAHRSCTSRHGDMKNDEISHNRPSTMELHDIINGDDDFRETTQWQQKLQENGLSKRHAAELVQQFRLRTLRLHDVQYPSSSSGGSIKLVFQLPTVANSTDRFIETVIIRHDSSSRQRSGTGGVQSTSGIRYTVCVSSQVGCTRACTFCATGTQMKFLSQLSSSDIVEQVYMAQQILNRIHMGRDLDEIPTCTEPMGQDLLRNVVFMGMGEPLDNWPAVYEACRTLTHQCIFHFDPKRITISTVGVSPNYIRQMAYDAPSIRLAISLHGATQSIREKLMPATKVEHASLLALESALDDHIKTTGQYNGPMIEYLLIDDVNDTEEAAQALVEFCQRRQRQQWVVASTLYQSTGTIPIPATYVNLIPYNPTLIGMNMYQYRTPTDEKILKFHERLQLQNGCVNKANIKAHIRWSSAASRDTNGACGQLALLSSPQQ